MTPDEQNMERLDSFIESTEHQSREEALAELASNGVDVESFKALIEDTVRKGYQMQIKLAAQKARLNATTKTSKLFGDLIQKSHAELLRLFETIKSGEFGSGLGEAALARCRNLQDKNPTEMELRSWLEDISALDES